MGKYFKSIDRKLFCTTAQTNLIRTNASPSVTTIFLFALVLLLNGCGPDYQPDDHDYLSDLNTLSKSATKTDSEVKQWIKDATLLIEPKKSAKHDSAVVSEFEKAGDKIAQAGKSSGQIATYSSYIGLGASLFGYLGIPFASGVADSIRMGVTPLRMLSMVTKLFDPKNIKFALRYASKKASDLKKMAFGLSSHQVEKKTVKLNKLVQQMQSSLSLAQKVSEQIASLTNILKRATDPYAKEQRPYVVEYSQNRLAKSLADLVFIATMVDGIERKANRLKSQLESYANQSTNDAIAKLKEASKTTSAIKQMKADAESKMKQTIKLLQERA